MKNVILVVLILGMLLLVGCSDTPYQPSQQQPVAGGGCGLAEPTIPDEFKLTTYYGFTGGL